MSKRSGKKRNKALHGPDGNKTASVPVNAREDVLPSAAEIAQALPDMRILVSEPERPAAEQTAAFPEAAGMAEEAASEEPEVLPEPEEETAEELTVSPEGPEEAAEPAEAPEPEEPEASELESEAPEPEEPEASEAESEGPAEEDPEAQEPEPEAEASEADVQELMTAAKRAQRNAEKRERRTRRNAMRATRAEEREILAEDRAARLNEFRQRREEERRRKQAEREEQERREEAERRSQPELSAEEAAEKYAHGIFSLGRRLPPIFAVAVLMAIFTLLDGAAFLPEVLRTGTLPVLLLLVMQLVVILLSIDILLMGITEAIRMKPGVETMVVLANLLAALDASLILSGFDAAGRTPYCAVAALATAFDLWGTYCRRCGFRDTIRSAGLASVPTVVTAEEPPTGGGIALHKRLGSARGFLNKCTRPDLAELFYTAVMPWYLLGIIILAVFASYLSNGGAVLHCAACLTSAAATFTAALVFSRPFSDIAKKLIANGAAIAGWQGAMDMFRAKQMIVRDLDIFPENTIVLTGMKVLSGVMAEKLVGYTGSVMLATGSGLKRVFSELMRQYAAPLYAVEEFDCGTEGGVCAYIQREQVLVGSSAYMNLMGIRVPGSMEVSGAVYTAIDHELCGLFVIQYAPVESVQASLYLLETGKLKPVFAVRDFNIYPAMMTQKFRLTERSISFRPVEERYALSEDWIGERLPAALLSREGIWHYLDAVRCGRRLVRTVRRGLGMTALGSVLGVLISFISFARGAYAAVSPWKLLTAMLLWAFATMMIAGSADGD